MSRTELHSTAELEDLSHEPSRPEAGDAGDTEAASPGGGSEHELSPVDGGKAAWRMLISAFIFESLLWGFPLSFGVFQNYYSHLPQFANQPYVAVIGTVASGISYMGAPVVIPLLKRVGGYRTYMVWGGWSLCIVALLASSFAHTLGAIIFTQGVMYGVGFTIFYYPILGLVNEYWVARRGMAYGLLCSASGVAGIVMPFSLEALLHRYGLATTLRAAAAGLAVSTGPLVFFIKGRNPVSQQQASASTNWSFLRVPLFWIYSISNLAQGFGYFFPSLYLPSYATTLGLSSRIGALLLAIMSISQVFGQFTFGYLSDRKVGIHVLMVISTAVAATAVLALWGLAHSFALLCIFVMIYGFFGAGYTALWGRMGTAVTSETTSAFAAFGLLNVGKGIGNVAAGPISGSLLTDIINTSRYGAARYEAVVVFSGTCMAASSVVAAAAYLKPWKASAQ